MLLPACNHLEAKFVEEEHHEAAHRLVVTSPVSRDIVSSQQYVAQIHSCRHIEVRALESGYLQEIPVAEGQTVEQGHLLFSILPTLYRAKFDAEAAEAQLAKIELANTQRLASQNVVSQQEVALAQAKVAKAEAQVELARAELNFATVKAPFQGIIDRLHQQQGSLVNEGDVLTTLSDNSVMWVYFPVPEARYLEYKSGLEHQNSIHVELVLANGEKFPYQGRIGAIEADFNNETGNIAFRADFPNPDGLLRHGQTGTIVISRVEENAVVIPQRATFEILAKKYAFVVEEVEPSVHSQHGGTNSTHAATERVATAHGEAEHGANEHSENEHGANEHAEAIHESHNQGEPAIPRTIHHGIVHQREIVILNEMDDIFLIEKGLNPNEHIVLEGVQQVRDGEEVEYEYRDPQDVLSNLKFKAE